MLHQQILLETVCTWQFKTCLEDPPKRPPCMRNCCHKYVNWHFTLQCNKSTQMQKPSIASLLSISNHNLLSDHRQFHALATVTFVRWSALATPSGGCQTKCEMGQSSAVQMTNRPPLKKCNPNVFKSTGQYKKVVITYNLGKLHSPVHWWATLMS